MGTERQFMGYTTWTWSVEEALYAEEADDEDEDDYVVYIM
jgi:hypothetical protein